MNRKLASVLHMKWIPDTKYENVIIGYWGEDCTQYKIECPHQLREPIIEMQNWLSDKYQTIEKMDRMVWELKQWFK